MHGFRMHLQLSDAIEIDATQLTAEVFDLAMHGSHVRTQIARLAETFPTFLAFILLDALMNGPDVDL